MCAACVHHDYAARVDEGEKAGAVSSTLPALAVPEALLFGDDATYHRCEVDEIFKGY